MTKILKDGFKTLIEFAENASVKFEEKTVTPPGLDGGGENDTTTMRNTLYRTKYPKHLITLTETSVSAAYDPAVYPQILSMVNVNQLITVTFADGDKVQFWGWLNEFKPGESSEGEQPMADITIIPSNQDNDGTEQPPVHVPA